MPTSYTILVHNVCISVYEHCIMNKLAYYGPCIFTEHKTAPFITKRENIKNKNFMLPKNRKLSIKHC